VSKRKGIKTVESSKLKEERKDKSRCQILDIRYQERQRQKKKQRLKYSGKWKGKTEKRKEQWGWISGII